MAVTSFSKASPPAAASPPRRLQSVQENLRRSNRRIVVLGAGGTGKTTLSASASSFAGDTIPAKETVSCSDVLYFQADEEGAAGALNAGFAIAHVAELSHTETWAEYKRELLSYLKEAKPMCEAGTIKYVIVDLAHPGRLISAHVNPSVQKDWQEVAALGGDLYKAFSGLRGVTVIGNAQIKAAQSPGETSQAADASAAKASGGERSTFTVDLNKGVANIWMQNSSLVLTRELKRQAEGVGKDRVIVPVYSTHTQSNNKHEAKSRFRSTLKPTEPGERSLNALLRQAYGDCL